MIDYNVLGLPDYLQIENDVLREALSEAEELTESLNAQMYSLRFHLMVLEKLLAAHNIPFEPLHGSSWS